MKFYNRETELAQLQNVWEKSAQTSQMTFVVGRRRTGKTSLLKKAFENLPSLYLFAGRKSEPLLCAEFAEQIKTQLQEEIFGTITRFSQLFSFLMNIARRRNFTLIIDEFQEFYNINPSVFSDMQNIWDSEKDSAKMNLILCGSVYSLMSKIFENAKEPLFGRANYRILVKRFSTATLKEILSDEFPAYNSEDLLAFYTMTGGVAKYVELLVAERAFGLNQITDVVFRENSLFLDEGRNVLIEEFGKDYATYFSILALIASSKTSRPEIESILEINTGGFLGRLENDFQLISRVVPIFAKPGSRNIKYRLEDNFLTFWFRFIYRNRSAVEIENMVFLKEIFRRDYNTFSGKMLEKYFTEKLAEEKRFSKIGTYWERGNLDEIDIVAENELEKTLYFAEVKRNKEKIDLAKLKEKSAGILKLKSGYSAEYASLSLEDM